MGGKNTKTSKKSDTPNDTVTLASSEQQVSTKKEKKVKEKKVKKIKEPKPVKEPKQEQFRPQVILPVNPEAEFANKEFLNDLSVFIMKAYDSQFRGSFNDYMVSYLAEDCIRELDLKHNGAISRGLQLHRM